MYGVPAVFFAKSSFALYEPGIDFIQGTDLILDD